MVDGATQPLTHHITLLVYIITIQTTTITMAIIHTADANLATLANISNIISDE